MLSAQTNFALNLLQENGLSESAVISPLSISIALDLVLFGAKNNTAEEIKSIIAHGRQITWTIISKEVISVNNDEEIHRFFSKIFLDQKDGVKMANKIYCVDDLKICESYKSLIESYYQKTLYQNLNFVHNAAKVSF